MLGVFKNKELHVFIKKTEDPGPTRGGGGKKNVETEFNFWCCLRYRADTQTYQPYNKDWIKEKIYVLLRRQAQQAAQ